MNTASIVPCLTGYLAQVFGQTRFFKTYGDARTWTLNVTGGR